MILFTPFYKAANNVEIIQFMKLPGWLNEGNWLIDFVFLIHWMLPGWVNEGNDLSEKELQRKECRRKSEENRNSKKKQIQVPADFLKIYQIFL